MFLALLSTDGRQVTAPDRARYRRRMAALAREELIILDEGAFFATLAPAMVPLRPLMARRHRLIAIGNVRLDNRAELRRGGGEPEPASDLDLVLRSYELRGSQCLSALLGDFALVIYDAHTRSLAAARDAFGVRTLFIGQRSGLVVLSSHLLLVHDHEELDQEFVADFLVGGDPGPERTIWGDSRAVGPGSILTVDNGRVSSRRFWNPDDFSPAQEGDERVQVDRFRELFEEAVSLRLEGGESTWAELSGGLDSSSVVCAAQGLAGAGASPEGLAGTVSVVDHLGSGDESRYSQLVVQRHGVRNERIVDPWPWQRDGRAPPVTDEPRAHYPYFTRDRTLHEIVAHAGGRILLTGLGADHYLYGNRLVGADLLAQGRVLACARDAIDWAVTERGSVWAALRRDVAIPLLPPGLQRWLAPPWDRVPSWIEPGFGRRTSIAERLYMHRTWAAPRGHKFAHRVSADLQELTHWLPRGPASSTLEFRHPFLYRPLVEFGLTLPASMRARPGAPKWVLREAMRGILPEAIRARPGKGAIDARFIWALSRERGAIDALVAKSRLAREGYVCQRPMVEAIQEARAGTCNVVVPLLCALALETWLAAGSGRWADLQPPAEERGISSSDVQSAREEVSFP